MRTRFPILLTALSLALAGPGTVLGKEGKEKDKHKDKKHDKAEKSDHREGHEDDDDDDERDRGGKVTICHVPPGNPSARHTITVGESAWSAHRKHGDSRGACRDHGGGQGGGQGDAFDRLDTSNDRRISRAEWPHGEESFNRLNRNADGFLSREEFSRFGGETSRPRFEDLDRDGNNSISRGEWPFSRESFDQGDRNHDNVISHEEYRRGA